jgi:hypothetical protein
VSASLPIGHANSAGTCDRRNLAACKGGLGLQESLQGKEAGSRMLVDADVLPWAFFDRRCIGACPHTRIRRLGGERACWIYNG